MKKSAVRFVTCLLYTSRCVSATVVGHPKQMNTQESENMRNIVPFFNQLRKKIPGIPVEFVDERFTSVSVSYTHLDVYKRQV